MLDFELVHREVLGIAACEPRADANRGSRNQTVGLAEGDPFTCELPTPPARELPLDTAQGRKAHSAEKAPDRVLLVIERSTHDLLDVDRAYPRRRLRARAQMAQTLGGGSAAERVDQHRGVKQQPQTSADARCVAASLRTHPASWVLVPFVGDLGERPKTRFDLIPTLRVLQRTAHRLRDERAAPSSADSLVESAHEIVIERYVQTHGHTLAHSWRLICLLFASLPVWRMR